MPLYDAGAIQDFKLGGAQLKKMCRAEGGANIFGVFRMKNHDFMEKNHIFSNFRGARAGCGPPPPLDPPLRCSVQKSEYSLREHYWCLRYNEERTIIQFRYTIE